MSPEFFLTSLIVCLIPGTGVIYTISTGLFRGWKASVFASWGGTLGIMPHIAASLLGLAAIMNSSAILFSIVKYLGVAYLLYLAWSMWRQKGSLEFAPPAGQAGGFRILTKAFLMNILNPKLTIFFLAFLPQFVSPGAESWGQMLVLSGLFMAMTLAVFLVYGALSHAIRAWVLRSPKFLPRLNKGFALVFAALGVQLAVSEK
jgi:threonine/homoserine/homoserine lactone efflux protein